MSDKLKIGKDYIDFVYEIANETFPHPYHV